MAAAEDLITEHLDLWTAAIQRKSGVGRGKSGSKKLELYGVKKLRELILELAVRGLLVPQDAGDEPAGVLLERIAAEKARLVAEGRIKRQKVLPPITDEETPFDLPESWEWVRLQNITSKITDGDHKTPARIQAGMQMLSAKNVRNGFVDFENCDFISKEDYLKSRERCLPETGDLLIVSVGGTIGRSALVPDKSNFSLVRSVALIKPIQFDSAYLKYAADSPLLQKSIHNNKRGGAQPCLYLSEISKFPFPLPPLSEQHRIVAKVDELMALCDQLEQRTEANIDAHQILVETLLARLTETPSPQPLSLTGRGALSGGTANHPLALRERGPGGEGVDWHHISNNFDSLFTTETSIDQLKQTILQLAVMGKLVPQDPNDEPASVLLEKIAAEKEKLVKEKKIKKQKALPPIADDEKPFELPANWEWARLGNTGIGATGKTPSTKKDGFFGGTIPFIGPGQITPNGQIMEPDKFLSESGMKNSEEALAGDILMVCIGGSIGKAAIAGKRLAFNQQINAMKPIKILPSFIYIGLSTKTFFESLTANASGSATPIINRSKWESLLVPVCPEAEQHRIVKKVTELLHLCDQLKTQLNHTQTTQIQLVDAITEQAIN